MGYILGTGAVNLLTGGSMTLLVFAAIVLVLET